MGTLIQLTQIPAEPALDYYRATVLAELPGTFDAVHDRSLYLHDLLQLCLHGAWDLELRQFMPPASLRESVDALLALGLIERVENPPPVPVPEASHRMPRPANQSRYACAPALAAA